MKTSTKQSKQAKQEVPKVHYYNGSEMELISVNNLPQKYIVSLEIDEYLTLLNQLLYSVTSNDFNLKSFFLDHFLEYKPLYEQNSDYNVRNKRFSIFAGAAYLDIPNALEYERLQEMDIVEYGMPSGNGRAQEFWEQTSIVDYSNYAESSRELVDESLLADLRNIAYASFKKDLNTNNTLMTERFQDVLLHLLDVLNTATTPEKSITNVKELQVIKSELENHASKFLEKKYQPKQEPLTNAQQVMFVMSVLHCLNTYNLTATQIANYMERLFGSSASTYRKLISDMSSSGCLGKYLSADKFDASMGAIIGALDEISGNKKNVWIDELRQKLTAIDARSFSKILKSRE